MKEKCKRDGTHSKICGHAHTIPNISPGLIFQGDYIRKDIYVSLQGGYIWGLIFGSLWHVLYKEKFARTMETF